VSRNQGQHAEHAVFAQEGDCNFFPCFVYPGELYSTPNENVDALSRVSREKNCLAPFKGFHNGRKRPAADLAEHGC